MDEKPARKTANKKYKGWDATRERQTYDEGFYLKHKKYYERGIQNFATWLTSNFEFESVADIGCGTGEFVQPLETSKKVLGVDFSVGAEKTLVIAKENYVDHDLTQLWPTDMGKWDLVYSLEVYEHIPGEFEDTYLSNLVALKPKHLIISCAEPGQWGRHHYNCNDKAHVIEKLSALGYTYDDALTQSFLKIKGLATFYKKNTAVFHMNTV